MALSLEDLQKLPLDITPEHVAALGLLPPRPAPAPFLPPATVAAMTPPAKIPHPNMGDAWKTGHSDLELGDMGKTHPLENTNLKPLSPLSVESPDVGGSAVPAGINVKPMTAPALNFHDRQALPEVSAGVTPGSSLYWENKIARQADEKQNPWGTAENHPGLIGKLGHIAAKVGNIAGNVVAPETMANLPGTEANKAAQMATNVSELGKAQNRESESKLRGAQAANLESEVRAREGNADQELVRDPSGNISGWKDKKGLHAIDDPNTPDSIKNIAASDQKKPTFHTDPKSGNIVKLSTDENGQTKADVVYKGEPGQKLETKEIVGADGHIHTKVVDMNAKDENGNPGKIVNDLGRGKEDKTVSPAAELAKELHGQKLVIATTKDGQAHLMTRAQAESDPRFEKNHIAVANESDRKDAEQNTAVLNDMGAKVQNVYRSADKALKQGTVQRGIISTVLQHGPDSIISLGALKLATPETKEYIWDVASLREAALALPKQTTGSGRVAETQAQALWNTVPGASIATGKDASKQLRKFNENLTRLWRKVPHIESNPQELVNIPEEEEPKPAAGAAGGASGAAAPIAPPPGKTPVYDLKGDQHFVITEKLPDFLKDPKYKGWSQSAPSSNTGR